MYFIELSGVCPLVKCTGIVQVVLKTLALVMLRTDPHQTEFVDFYLPFTGHLLASNRWVKLSALVPWAEFERCYRDSFVGSGMGAPAKSGRIAYGALLIKERLNITDEETVEQILENPYLQYFLGLKELREEPLFDPSMMVHFRSRFTPAHHELINSAIIEAARCAEEKAKDPNATEGNDEDDSPPSNSGKLLVDATCTPADIKYPTDLGLLNEAREKTEAIIDKLHSQIGQCCDRQTKKPRTYRQKARKQYLSVAKQKKPGAKKFRKAIGQQLNYLKRNLGHIEKMTSSQPGLLSSLKRYGNIRLSGKPLGGPKKQTTQNAAQLKAEKVQQRQNECDRIPVEGKFGNCKRKGSLGRIMAKLAHTSESVIHVGIIVLNLGKRLRTVLFWLYQELLACQRRALAFFVVSLLPSMA